MNLLTGNTFTPLQITQTDDAIAVSGTTFVYTFSRKNGLITDIRIQGDRWLANRHPIPDIWVSDAVHPSGCEFKASRETEARVQLRRTSSDQTLIRARGRYLNKAGDAFPLEYTIEYTIDADGIIKVEVENRATGRGSLRWLTFSAGSLPTHRIAFVNHSEDLAVTEAQTGNFTSEPVPQTDGPILTGRYFPWLQFGDDRAGLDLTVDEADAISFGYTDSQPYTDGLGQPGATCELFRDRSRVSWRYFSIRNLYTPLRRGWSRKNRFYLGVVPAKKWNPALADIRVNWVGPHQINPDFVYPTDDQIAEMGRQGINLLLGCAHWRSGLYSKPLEPDETRRVIDTCHRNGIKIIPYLTFTDLNHQLPAFQKHGQEWQIEPVAEFRHLTNLMCYGAEGWRAYWKKEIDTALDRFPFDGLYIDFWVGKMACTNPLHGCDHRYARYTLPGLRDMAMHAFRRVRERDGFILSNTNMCAGALINNLVDIRLPGEWGNVEETPLAVVRGYMNSRRLGCNSLLLASRIPRFTLRSVSLALRCQSSITGWRGRKPAERRLFMQYADILRSFGIANAQSLGAWEEEGSLTATPAEMVTYWYRNKRGSLLFGIDTGGKSGRRKLRIEKPSRIGLRPDRRYLLFRPDVGSLLMRKPTTITEGHLLTTNLKPWAPLLVHIQPYKNRPQLLWATFSDGFEERWNTRRKTLTLRITGNPGARSRLTIHIDGHTTASIVQNGQKLRYRDKKGLLVFTASTNKDLAITFD